MKRSPACGGAGMSPDGSRQVRLCPDCRGLGYLHYEFSVTMRAQIAKKRKERPARRAARKDSPVDLFAERGHAVSTQTDSGYEQEVQRRGGCLPKNGAGDEQSTQHK
jgi:hypothetical protein